MAHIHTVVDTDVHYKIDGVTRTITNITETKRELVQHDHNSERFTFEIPRYVDSHDFTECNVVQVHYANIDKFGKIQSEDIYEVDDLRTSPEDENTVIFSWLISGNATISPGTLDFSILLSCVSNGDIDYAWNTTEFRGIKILPSRRNYDPIVERLPDVLSNWKVEFEQQVRDSVDEIVDSGELKGEKGDPGEKGEKGDPGKDGTGVTILGSYDSESALNSAHPTGNAGDAYMVGSSLYVWSATETKWINVGNIKGETGTPGYTPVKGKDYYTEAEKSEFVTDVLEALPLWTGGSF